MNHSEQCKEIIGDVQELLAAPSESNPEKTNNEVLCHLSSILAHQNAGKPGAGLTGGMLQESLWVDMLTSSKKFSSTPVIDTALTIDADYYFGNYPISHKTIGPRNWDGSGNPPLSGSDLALAWSKNPEGGVQRVTFKASIAIAYTGHSNPNSKSKWGQLDHGYYMIPLDYLDDITLKSNNKTDSLIPKTDVLAMMTRAKEQSLFAPLQFDYFKGKPYKLSYFKLGLDGIILSDESFQ